MGPRRQADQHAMRQFWALCAVTVLLLLGFLAVFTSNLDEFVRRTTSDVGLLLGGLGAAISCGLRWHRTTDRRRRRAWVFLGAAGLCAAIGNSWVLYAHLADLSEQATSYGDVGFAAALLLGIAALLSFPTIRRRGLDLARILFDGVVVGGSLLSIVGVTLFPQLLQQTGSAGARAGSLITTVVDVVITTLAAMLIIRGDRVDRTVLLLLGAGSTGYALSDLGRAALTAQGTFQFGGPVDIGWIAGYAAFALAARHPNASGTHTSEAPAAATPPLVSSSLTFGMFLAAALIRVWRLPDLGTSLLTSLIWVTVLFAVTIRQGLLIMDNETLRRDLERRVEERTAELAALTRTSQTMLTSVGDGIYGVDKNGAITFANPSTLDLLGFAEGEMIGADAHELFHAPSPSGEPFPTAGCYINEAIRDRTVTTSEEDQYRRRDGKIIPVEVTASPLLGDVGVEGAVITFRDMTQRREVDRMKSEFVSVVSHELRTPLTSIRGSLGLLSAGALGELSAPAQRMVKIALDSSERLTRLINDILDIERIESGTMPMQMGRQRTSALVETAVEQTQALAAESQIEIRFRSTDAEIWADGDRVVQTVVNLLGNAIKFSEPGSAVEVSAEPDGGLVAFRVRDHGRGIPEDKLQTIFLRFEQVDSSDAREKGGSGLGLAISRSIVERHGGTIWAESVEGEGATLVFTIPLAPQQREVSELDGRPTVLVCDDDADFVEVISLVLERRGFRTLGATDPARAITIATEHRPDAILLDLMMGSTQPEETVAALRQDERTRGIPIIVVSGLSPVDELGVSAETEDWLVKPVDEDRLTHTLRVNIADHPIRGHVLLVEDDEATAAVITILLVRRGLQVTHAQGREEALRLVQQIRPEIMILDLQLPDGTGQQLIEAMREDPELRDLAVVVYSASDLSSAQRDDLSLGRTVFLTKGHASPQSLEERVIDLIGDAIELREVKEMSLRDPVG